MTTKVIRTSDTDDAFFAALAGGKPPGMAAAGVGYTLSLVMELRAADADFAKRWKDADTLAVERMEADASEVETLISGIVTAAGIFWSLWHHTPEPQAKPNA